MPTRSGPAAGGGSGGPAGGGAWAGVPAPGAATAAGPIDRGIGETAPAKFSGDDPRHAHRILWDKPAWLASHGGRYPLPEKRVPLLVVGVFRSGTSLTEQILASHSADAAWRQRAELLNGNALEELGRAAEAAAVYRALAGGKPDDAVLAEALYRLAGIEYRAARYAAARDLYAKLLADHPGSPFVRDAVFFLAESEYALEADSAAEKRYRTLLSVYPDSPYRETATFRIAGILARTGRADAALEQLEAYLAAWPRGAHRSAAYRLQGDVLYGRKRYEDALGRYEKALAVAPDEASRQATRLAVAETERARREGERATRMKDFLLSVFREASPLQRSRGEPPRAFRELFRAMRRATGAS